MRYVIKIAYDGTAYGGWQTQKNTVTVQQKLEEALFAAVGKKVNVAASGRTDAGVHAAAQICHFDAETTIPPERFPEALNCRLPADISVLDCAAAPENFDCSRSAKRKTYCYRAYVSPRRNPLKDRYSVHVKTSVDIAKLRHICGAFVGEHDFKAYCASGSDVKTTVRTVYEIVVKTGESACGTDIEIYVTGSGFLYNMVRTMVGTAIGYACGAVTEERVVSSIENADRSCVGKTMPAKGLTLEKVEYDSELFLK